MSHQLSLAGPLMMFVAGSLLLALPTFIKFSLLTFMGSDNPMSLYVAGYNVNPLLVFVRIVGIGSFVRGIVLLSRSGHQQGQQGTLGKALIHMGAGILCIHVVGTYQLLTSIF